MSFEGIETWPTAGQDKLDGRRTRSRSSSASSSASDHSDASKLSVASTNSSNTSFGPAVDETSCGSVSKVDYQIKLDYAYYGANATEVEVINSFSSDAAETVEEFQHSAIDHQAQAGRRQDYPSSLSLKTEELPSSLPQQEVFASVIPTANAACLNTFLDPKSVCKTHSLSQLLLAVNATQEESLATQFESFMTLPSVTNGPGSTPYAREEDSFDSTPATEEESIESEIVANKPAGLEDVQPHLRPGTNPRRTSAPKGWSKPTLERQTARKQDYVMHLVDATCQLLHFLWPNTATPYSSRAAIADKPRGEALCALPNFLQELLKRCHATYSALTMALYYICLLQTLGKIPSPQDKSNPMHCGRRVFLGALILATKYLQDKSYSMRAWHKVTNIAVKEITCIEKTVLQALDYKMHVPLEHYNNWCAKISIQVEAAACGQICPWKETLDSFAEIKMVSKPSTSLLSSPADIMSELRLSPAAGMPTLSSAMPYLCKNNGSLAPRPASLTRQATSLNYRSVSGTSLKKVFIAPETIDLTLSPPSFTSSENIDHVIDLTTSPNLLTRAMNVTQAIDLTTPAASPSWSMDTYDDLSGAADLVDFTTSRPSNEEAMNVLETIDFTKPDSYTSNFDVNTSPESLDDLMNAYVTFDETISPPISLTSADEQSITYSQTTPLETTSQAYVQSAESQASQYPTPPPSLPNSPAQHIQAAPQAAYHNPAAFVGVYGLSPASTDSYVDVTSECPHHVLLGSSPDYDMQGVGGNETSPTDNEASPEFDISTFIDSPRPSDQCSKKRSRCVSEEGEEDEFEINVAATIKRLRSE